MKKFLAFCLSAAFTLSTAESIPALKADSAEGQKFTHQEWTGKSYTDLNGKTQYAEDVFAINREQASVNPVPFQDSISAQNAVWDYNSREDSDYFQLLTGYGNDWELNVVQNAEQAQKYLNDSIDAIVSFRHPYGCSQMGDDQENTREILADLITHPNAGGVLVMGLGCENSNIEEVKKHISWCDEGRTMFMIAQEEDDDTGHDVTEGLVQTENGGNFARTAFQKYQQEGGEDHRDGIELGKP